MRHRLRLESLRALIARTPISQNHWAIRLGLSRGHWSDLLNGRHPYPSARTRQRLLEVFDVPSPELFEEEQADGPPDESLVRRALGTRYEFLSEVGRGATGVVLSAQDRRLGRLVAIKIVQPEAIAGVGTEQLITELGVSSKLTHPNILPLHDAGVEHGHPYVVSPLVRGGSLRARLDRDVRLPLDDALPVIEGVARALAFAHSRQALHCDVKPENILLEDGHAYLTDFGIARRLQSEAEEWGALRVDVGYSAGTPAYVSPEQAAGEAIDQRSDVYSLGCVAYEMLAGRLPFEGRNTQETVARRFQGNAPPLRDTAPDVPQAVADVVARAMSLSPARRPDSALAFATELREAARSRSWFATSLALHATRGLTRIRSRFGFDGPARLRLPLSGAIDDLRYTLRGLRRDWRFTLNIVASLGLGLGIGLPAISLADHVFLRPPVGVAEPERVVRLIKEARQGDRTFHQASVTGLDLQVQSEARTLESLAATFSWRTHRGRGGDAVPVSTLLVTASYFEVLGLRPALGRFFSAAEDVDGALAGPAVISHRYWMREYGGRPDALGATVQIGRREYTVVGVTPERFEGVGLGMVDLFLPLHVAGREYQGDSPRLFTTDASSWVQLIARLAPGVSPALAMQESNALYRRPGTYVRDRERTNVLHWESIIPGRSLQRPAYANLSLWTSVGALLLLLLVAANLVNLFVARAAARARQTAIRIALGARTGQLLRLHLAETLVLGGAGAALGVAVAAPLAGIARAMLVPGLAWSRPALDLRLVAIALGLAFVAGGVAAVAAFAHARRVEPAELIRSAGSGRGGIGRRPRTIRAAMIVAQATVFSVLLTLAIAFVGSIRRVTRIDHGFRIDGLAFVQLKVPGATAEQRATLLQLAERVRQLPAVQEASLSYMVPFWNNSNERVFVPGLGDTLSRALWENATPEHLEVLGAGMREGRWIAASDVAGSEPVIVVNEEFARLAWPDGGALGRCVRVGADSMPCRTVVGVMRNARFGNRVDSPFEPTYAIPYAQAAAWDRAGHLVIRVRKGAAVPAEAIRQVIKGFDPDLPPASVVPMSEHLAWMTQPYEVGRATFLAYGALAALIALVGLSGVLAYLVAQDRTAFAVRIALGAPLPRVVRPVVVRALALVTAGMLLGLVILFALRARLDAMLFQTSVLDPLIIGPVLLLGAVMASIAAYAPVRSITRIAPMQVLREE